MTSILEAPEYGMPALSSYRIFTNPASLSQVDAITAGLYFSRRYQLAALQDASFFLAIPAGSGNFCGRMDFAGGTDYHEWQLGIGYGRRIGERLALGAWFNAFHLGVAGYENATSITTELGIFWNLKEKWKLGLHLSNPFGIGGDKSNPFQIPFVARAGLGYTLNENFMITGEFRKEEGSAPVLQFTFYYLPISRLDVAAGLATGLLPFYLSIGYRISDFRIAVYGGFHQLLGYSPGLAVFYPFGKPRKS